MEPQVWFTARHPNSPSAAAHRAATGGAESPLGALRSHRHRRAAGAARRPPLAATTIATLLSRLERRGIVAYRTEGRQYVYRAVLTERDARQHALVEVTKGLFEGDIATLVSQLLSSHELRSGDLAKVKALIEAKEQEARKRRRS